MRTEPAEAFGWLDRPGATGKLAALVESGRISPGEGESLRHWAESGYLVLPQAVEPDAIAAAVKDIDDTWQRKRHVSIDILSTGERRALDEVPGETRGLPYKINDLYLVSEPALRAFLHPRIVRMCELILGDRVVGCNSLTFESGSQQPPHVDHVYMTPSPPRRLVASWIALEDVHPDAGPLLLWSGSHRLPPFNFGESGYHFTPQMEQRNTAYLSEQKERFPRVTFMAKKGDVLLWHSMLIHGGAQINDPMRSRKSMACHYFGRTSYGDGGAAALRACGRAFFQEKPIDEPTH
jgi:phytanoyl-CoA hydroxylase